VISYRLVGIQHGKGRDCVIEYFALAHIAGEAGRIARSCVRTRQGPAAELGVAGKSFFLAYFANAAESAIL